MPLFWPGGCYNYCHQNAFSHRVAHDQTEVAQIDEYADSLVDDKCLIFGIKRFGKERNPTPQTEAPECGRNCNASQSFTLDMLDNKAYSEKSLARQ